MSRIRTILCSALALLVLGACSEKPQTQLGAKNHAPAYQGTGSQFVDAGWKAGDKTSWEQHLRARQQRGQNDYSRMP